MTDTPKRSPARALRAAGFVKTPRLWVTPEQASQMYDIAAQSLPEVSRITAEARGKRPPAEDDDIPDWQRFREEDDDAMDF